MKLDGFIRGGCTATAQPLPLFLHQGALGGASGDG